MEIQKQGERGARGNERTFWPLLKKRKKLKEERALPLLSMTYGRGKAQSNQDRDWP